MPSTSLFTSEYVNPEEQVDRSTGEQVHNIHLPFVSIFSSGRVNFAFGQVICYGYSVFVHLSTCQPVPRVDRNLPGLTGREVNI